MGFFDSPWEAVKRTAMAAATGGISELGGARTLYDGASKAGISASTFGLGPGAKPDPNAYTWGGSPEAAAAARNRYQGGTDRTLGAAADRYTAMADGTGPSQANELGARMLAQSQAQSNMTAASARGGAANALAAQRMALAQQGDMTLGAQSQARQTAMAEQQAGVAGLAGIGAQYLGAETGMEQAQLGATSAADQARINADSAAQQRRAQMTLGAVQGAQKAAAGAA